jgi:hypothetical protein
MQLSEMVNLSFASFVTRAAAVIGIVLLYEGSSRAASGNGKRKSIWMIIGGAAICLTLGTTLILLGNFTQKVSSIVGHSPMNVPPLPRNWGADLTPEERERNSRAWASLAFTSTGNIIEYVDREGNWSSYSPSENEIRNREEAAAVRARLDLNPALLIGGAFDLFVTGVMGAFLGCCIGYRRRTRTADTLQPTAEKLGG